MGTRVWSISVTPHGKCLSVNTISDPVLIKLRLHQLFIGNGQYAECSPCHLALLISLVEFWSMQMCRAILILVGLTQIRCLSGILAVHRWRQDRKVEQGRRIPPTPAQRSLPKSAKSTRVFRTQFRCSCHVISRMLSNSESSIV